MGPSVPRRPPRADHRAPPPAAPAQLLSDSPKASRRHGKKLLTAPSESLWSEHVYSSLHAIRPPKTDGDVETASPSAGPRPPVGPPPGRWHKKGVRQAVELKFAEHAHSIMSCSSEGFRGGTIALPGGGNGLGSSVVGAKLESRRSEGQWL